MNVTFIFSFMNVILQKYTFGIIVILFELKIFNFDFLPEARAEHFHTRTSIILLEVNLLEMCKPFILLLFINKSYMRVPRFTTD